MSECRYCGVGLGDKRSWVCAPCSIVRDRIRARTHIAVGNAIRNGVLHHPRMFFCVDCEDKQAECYDHRDYRKPLDVDPVCRSCDKRRGTGYPLRPQDRAVMFKMMRNEAA